MPDNDQQALRYRGSGGNSHLLELQPSSVFPRQVCQQAGSPCSHQSLYAIAASGKRCATNTHSTADGSMIKLDYNNYSGGKVKAAPTQSHDGHPPAGLELSGARATHVADSHPDMWRCATSQPLPRHLNPFIIGQLFWPSGKLRP